MAKIDFSISFTTQSGQRKRIKTGQNLSVLGKVIADQYISIAKTETARVMASSMAGSTFSSIRDFIQAVAIVFQRVVARTPVDEAYKTKYKQTGKVRNSGGKGKPKEDEAEHKPDNDSLRDDWVCNLKFDDFSITIKSTDYDVKIFEKINDKESIQVIVNDIVKKLSSFNDIKLDKRGVNTKVSVNFENKNGHFAKLEYGYGGRSSSHEPVKGDKRYHGLVNGFSVQAPSGFFRISMIELGQIMSIKGRANVAKRLEEKCYDIAKSNKFFLNKMSYMKVGSESRLKQTFNDIGKDNNWKVNFNDLWKFAVRNEAIRRELERIDDDKLRLKASPDVYIHPQYENILAEEEIKSLEESLNFLNQKEKVYDYETKRTSEKYVYDMPPEKRKQFIEDIKNQIKALRSGGRVSDSFRSSFEDLNGSMHGQDYLSQKEQSEFTKKYMKRQTMTTNEMREFETAFSHALKKYDEMFPTLSAEKVQEKLNDLYYKKGLEILKEQAPNRYQRFLYGKYPYDTSESTEEMRLRIIKNGEHYYKKNPDILTKIGIDINNPSSNTSLERSMLMQEFARIHRESSPKRYITESNNEMTVLQAANEEFYKRFEKTTTHLRKAISDYTQQLNILNDNFDMFKQTRIEILRSRNSKSLIGKTPAQINTILNGMFNNEYKKEISDYNSKIAHALELRTNRQYQLFNLKQKQLPLIEQELKDKGYGLKTNNEKGISRRDPTKTKRGTMHFYTTPTETKVNRDSRGKPVLTYSSPEFIKFKGILDKRLDEQRRHEEISQRIYRNRFRKKVRRYGGKK